MNASITAVSPSLDHKTGFMAMLADFEALDPHSFECYAPAKTDFEAYVQRLIDDEQGLNLAADWVPCTHRWVLDEAGQIVGVVRIRHNIDTPLMATDGGHIGYDVAPSQRRRGYGYAALQIALEEAAHIGLSRVLLYTAENNVASRTIIERAGGILESIAYSEFWQEQQCKYWLDVPPMPARLFGSGACGNAS